MIPVWQMMLGVCVGFVAFILTRPKPIEHVECKSNFNCEPGENCPICLCEMNNAEMTYLQCGHALHSNCLTQGRKHLKQCPICRKEL